MEDQRYGSGATALRDGTRYFQVRSNDERRETWLSRAPNPQWPAFQQLAPLQKPTAKAGLSLCWSLWRQYPDPVLSDALEPGQPSGQPTNPEQEAEEAGWFCRSGKSTH